MQIVKCLFDVLFTLSVEECRIRRQRLEDYTAWSSYLFLVGIVSVISNTTIV